MSDVPSRVRCDDPRDSRDDEPRGRARGRARMHACAQSGKLRLVVHGALQSRSLQTRALACDGKGSTSRPALPPHDVADGDRGISQRVHLIQRHC